MSSAWASSRVVFSALKRSAQFAAARDKWRLVLEQSLSARVVLLAADGSSWLVAQVCSWNSLTMNGTYIHVLLGSRDARNVNRNDRNAGTL